MDDSVRQALVSVKESYDLAVSTFPEGSSARGMLEGFFVGVMPQIERLLASPDHGDRKEKPLYRYTFELIGHAYLDDKMSFFAPDFERACFLLVARLKDEEIIAYKVTETQFWFNYEGKVK